MLPSYLDRFSREWFEESVKFLQVWRASYGVQSNVMRSVGYIRHAAM